MTSMNRLSSSIIKTSGGVDLAFAIVVLASYLATFSGVQEVSPLKLVLMIVLGMAYLTIGIYGYSFCARADWLPLSLAYFVIQVLIGGVFIYLGRGVGFSGMVLLPLAGQAVVLVPQRWAYGINAGILAIYIGSVYLVTGNWEAVGNGLPIFLAGLVFIVVFTQMAVSEEKARSEVERLVKELQDANKRLREYVTQIEELAIAKERNRLAREIHDGLGHYLTTIHMQIQAGRAIANSSPKSADSLFEKAQVLTQDALDDVRKSVSALRSDPNEGLPLPQLVEKLLDTARLQGIEAAFHVVGTQRMTTPQTKLTIYRAAQEGISNTCKHAKADHLWITLDFTEPDCVRLNVRDDGVGTEDMDGGFGLMGLKERVHLLDGSLQIDSKVGKGFSFNLVVPG